jgi:REP element-mobilizing transposase RayT
LGLRSASYAPTSRKASPDKSYPSGFAFGFDPTGRCHKREFLLKFAKDRNRWLELLLEAKKRFGLIILNYTVTSNHIHLLVFDGAGKDVIPRAMQLIAGRTGQEYNRRKSRKVGCFKLKNSHSLKMPI